MTYRMLHHYNPNNYTNTLGHFLNYHRLDERPDTDSTTTPCDDLSQSEDCRSGPSPTPSKSFTIAAILGLDDGTKGGGANVVGNLPPPTAPMVNLNDHPFAYGRLQLPVRPGAAYGPPKSAVRGMKQTSTGSTLHTKKNSKSKRVRTIFTPEQLERLEAEFERQQYMVGPERLYLAHTLQLTEAQVKVWFQNRRIKWRKHNLELSHQRLAVLKQQQQLLLDDTNLDVQDTNSSSTDT